jgi:hypothetical protein
LHEYLVKGYSVDRRQLRESPEKIDGLQETMEFMQSDKHPGKLKGKIVFKLTKHLEPIEEDDLG